MAASSELAVFQVNGQDVTDGSTVNLDPNTTSVAVTATPVDQAATVAVVGDTGLSSGSNDLTVTVTATDATSSVYSVTLNVLPSTDAGALIYVNGDNRVDGEDVYVPYGTYGVTVEVVTSDVNATYFVDGDLGLETGDNDLVVTVTAADGETTQQYFINLNVLPNTDTSISSLTINGISAVDGDYVTLDAGTIDADIVVETTDPNATYEVIGGTDLVKGENDVVVTVTAVDGSVASIYVTIVIAASSDVSLESLTVNGESVDDGGTVYLEPFTTDVEVAVTTTDSDAVYLIDGESGLGVGENTLTVIVVAADGETNQEYIITLVVSANHDASISAIYVTYNNLEGPETAAVSDGDSLDLPAKNYSVDVEVDTADEEATVEIQGNTDLVPGENTMTITVTAADGETTQDAYITLVLAVGDVTTSSFTVDGNEVSDGDVVNLEHGTESVEVYVETMDEEATFEVNGDTGLVLGENELVVAVTSADGALTVEYKVTLVVLPYTDASYSSIEVNGIVWEDGTPVETEAGDIDVVVYTNNEFSTVTVDGQTTNVSGLTHLTVTVTAQDGETTETAEIDVIASTDVEVVPVAGDDIRVGSWIKISRGQFDKAAKLQYFWLRDMDENPIATGAKYQATLDDYGHDLRAVVIISMKGQSDRLVLSKKIEVLPGIMKKAPTPSIKGKAVVGNTLTASTKSWMDGVELAYQWYRNGEAVDGANGETYDLTPEDVDSTISIGITGTLEGFEPLEMVSKSVTVAPGVLKYSDRPSISGDFVTGGTVEVNPGTWLDGAEISLKWTRNGEEIMTTSAEDNSYVLTQEDYGKRVGVTVMVSAMGYKDAIFNIKSRQIKVGTLTEVPTPVINGSPIVGETIDVDMGEYPDGATFTYVWKRDGRVIQSAYDAAYTLTPRDANTSITVKIIAKIWGYKTVRVESDGVSVSPAQ